MISLDGFSDITFIDFEFSQPRGELPSPICLVGHELHTGVVHRVWQDELLQLEKAPYPTGEGALVVAYYASAEMNCHLALKWDLPLNIIDLYVEFRVISNGKNVPCGNGLLGALAYFGLGGMDAVEKEEMRNLAIRGGPWSPEEKTALIDYCETDVVALHSLYARMK